MTTRQFVSTKGDTWEWEETPEVAAAIAQLHKTTKDTERKIAKVFFIQQIFRKEQSRF